MRKIGDIHVFEDQRFLNAIKRDSIVALVAGIAVAALWGIGMQALREFFDAPVTPFELDDILGSLGAALMGAEGRSEVNLMWWLLFAVGNVLALVVHELVHAFFFRQYAPAGTKISFGANAKTGMLYASAEGIVYSRAQYLVIALAPSVVVTMLVIAIGMGLAWPLWTILICTAHLSGCAGDWEYARTLLRDPDIAFCRDTAWGVEFYGNGTAAHEGDADSADAPPRAAFTVVDGGKSS